jgi:hypothetical protein
VLIGFSNGICGAKRLTAPRSLGDLDNDMSCHLANNGTGGTKFQLQFLIAVCKTKRLISRGRKIMKISEAISLADPRYELYGVVIDGRVTKSSS